MYRRYLKRIFDILAAVALLPIFFLVTTIIAPMIKAEDGGPIFYISMRVGRNQKIFKFIKFRTMIVNAPDIRFLDGSTYNAEDDPRVTKIGRFLRNTSLDEIPQLINVLIGDLSMIGPRPDLPDCVKRYLKEAKVILGVRPGITGYSQAYFRNSIVEKEKIKNDIYYAIHYSFLMDIKILIKTLVTICKRENTYHTNTYMEYIEVPQGKIICVNGFEEAKCIPGIVEIRINKRVGDIVENTQQGLNRIGYLIAQGNSVNQAKKICKSAKKLITLHMGEI